MDIAAGLAMQERARRRIPGMTHLLSKRPDMFSLGVWPGYYSRAKGARLWDLDGNEYLDMSIGGIGACVLGYADDDVDEAVIRTIRNGVSSSLNCPEEVELAETLCALHPWADMVRLSRCGGEAMAMAVRIARAATGRDVVAFCGYHGWHDWYLAANLRERDALGGHLISGLEPAGVPRALAGTALPFRYNRLDELERIAEDHGQALAAIVMEPLRSEEPQPGFVEGVRAVADACGAVLVMDEISAGFRLVTGGAHLAKHTVAPDMAVFSKALGNGYPIAAVIGAAGVMQAAQKTFISSTNWTERTGPAAALAMLEKHQRLNVGAHLVTLGDAVQKGWREKAAKHGVGIAVGGMAPMSHFSFDGPLAQEQKAYFVQFMLERGILASNLFYAMYAHSFSDVEGYLEACDEAFGAIAAAGEGVAGRLKGKPATVGFKRIA